LTKFAKWKPETQKEVVSLGKQVSKIQTNFCTDLENFLLQLPDFEFLMDAYF